MWQEVTSALKKIILLDERTEKNAKDIADIQEELRNLTKAVERLAYEIKRIDEREAYERENLRLKLENEMLRQNRALPAVKPKRAKTANPKKDE